MISMLTNNKYAYVGMVVFSYVLGTLMVLGLSFSPWGVHVMTGLIALMAISTIVSYGLLIKMKILQTAGALHSFSMLLFMFVMCMIWAVIFWQTSKLNFILFLPSLVCSGFIVYQKKYLVS